MNLHLTNRMALDLVEWIASNEGLNRSKTIRNADGEYIDMETDTVLDQIYEIVHVARGRCKHQNWEDKATKLWTELHNKGEF